MNKDWIEVELGSVLIQSKQKHNPTTEQDLFYVGLEHIEKELGTLTDSQRIEKITTLKNKFEQGQILYGKLRPYLNKVYLAKESGVCSTDILVFQPKSAIFPRFAHLFMLSRKFVNHMSENTSGVNLPRVSTSYINSYPFPLPPLPEQRAIVARIEELFSELDHSISNLQAAQAKLEIYRQAVLKMAFEGGFTEEWRKTNSSNSGSELISQIKIEQEKWIDIETKKGNSEAKRLKSKLKKVKSTFLEFKELPPSWTWTTILESSNLVVDCHNKTAPYEKDGVFLIRTTNVKNGRLNLLSGIRFISQKTFDYWSRRCVPESGDLLFTREAPMGEVAIIPENTQVCLGQRMMLFRVFNEFLDKRYLYYAIQDPRFQERMDKSAIGTGVKHLRVGDVENLSFPICSPNEQAQIVQEIESRLSVADKMAETIQTSLQKAEALRQSILKKAFEGKLLSEAEVEACRKESDWEPSERLLERIKQEKSKPKN